MDYLIKPLKEYKEMILNSLEETTLWKKLNTGFDGIDKQIASMLSNNLIQICKEASERMKKCLVIHKEYTLHDEAHLLRVTEIISKILGNEGLNVLNPVEIFLLILSAYFHDIGMILDDNKIESLEKDDEYKLFKANWIIEHPNYRETEDRIKSMFYDQHEKDECIKVYNDLKNAIMVDFIRRNHGILSKQYIDSTYSEDHLWQVQSVNISNFVGRICLSHSQDIHNLTNSNDYRVDENIENYIVNLQYISILLRLADILDFDRKRTPDTLYKSIHFTSNISLNEWEKHRSVVGWEISQDIIRFSVQCTHPIYQKTVLQFMDWIDEELNNANSIVSNFPSGAVKYKLNLPIKVDRSRIQPKNNSYIYHDLEFSLSRDEIVKLLMMDELYNSPSLCVRELLQNALDALRFRKNKIKSDLGTDWNEGKVILKHYVDGYGREVLLCEDNGIGMDENIIQNYLTKTGRSYYKSPEFEKEKEKLKQKGIKFYPCSQFGIGFMSCFMIGDLITIRTRKDFGYGKQQGKPLVVEINGLNGIIIIREGEKNQPIGTSVYITGRTKPEYLDEGVDKVWLLETLSGFALACEFPIIAECTIEEIKGSITIPARIIEPKTFIEKTHIKSDKYKTYEQQLTEIDSNLRGKIKASFLVDEKGKLTLDNDEAYWDSIQSKYEKYRFIIKDQPDKLINIHYRTATCCDGILVCGTPGLDLSKHPRLQESVNLINLGYETFVVDIRNEIKPLLTPSRMAKDDNKKQKHQTWRYIHDLIDEAQGKLWSKVLMDVNSEEEMEVFYELASIYRFKVVKLPIESIWNKVYVPVKNKECYSWIKLSNIDMVKIDGQGKETNLFINDLLIEPDESLRRFDSRNNNINSIYNIYSIIKRMSALEVNDDSQLFLHILHPSELNSCYSMTKYDSKLTRIIFMPYYRSSSAYFSIQAPFKNININHPLAVYIQKNKYKQENNNRLFDFAANFIFFVTDKRNFDLVKDDKVITRWMKRLGYMYQLVNWDEYPEYCTDYTIWSKDKILTITKNTFIQWAQAKNEDVLQNNNDNTNSDSYVAWY